MREASGALVTNVSADHLGLYGVMDVATMARVKWVTTTVVGPDGRVVLNAEDEGLMALMPSCRAPLALVGLDPNAPVVVAHRRSGGEAWLLRGDALIRAKGDEECALASVSEVPIAFGGAAPYNVANALAAGALASAMGIGEEAICAGLRSFTPSFEDNPGRSNLVERGGVKILVDFAHNPEGIAQVFALADQRCAPEWPDGWRSSADTPGIAAMTACARPRRSSETKSRRA